jgi:hypothetical protein
MSIFTVTMTADKAKYPVLLRYVLGIYHAPPLQLPIQY